MPTVNDVLRLKGQTLITIDVSASALDAVRLMNERHIGSVLVMEDGDIAGIFSERDVLRRIVAAGVDPNKASLRQVMTHDVVTCNINADLDEIAQIMQSRRIRHIPVRDSDDRVIAMISIGDVNAFNVRQKQATIENMTDYICGRA